LRAAVPLLAGIKERVMRDEYVRRLSGWLGFDSPEPVAAAVRERLGENAPARPAERRERQPDDMIVGLERQALKAALQRPQLAGPAFDQLAADHFSTEFHRELRDAIAKAGGASSAVDAQEWIGRVSAASVSEQLQKALPALAVEPLPCEDDDERVQSYVSELIARLQELHTTRRIRDVKARVQRVNPVTETETYHHLFGELIALEERRRQLRERGSGAA
jgi:DNA primase